MEIDCNTLRRGKILSGFYTYGFRGLTSFLNVCVSIDSELDTNKLSAFWRTEIEDAAIYNKLEDIIEFLKNE